MLRTRFFFGLSVLFLAGGIVVTAQGQGKTPKTTHTTVPKAAAPAPHTTSKAPAPKPAKTMQPPVKAQHTSPASGKTQAPKTTVPKHASTTAPSKPSASKTQKADTSVKLTAKSTTKGTTSDKPSTKAAKVEKPATSTKSTTASSTSTSTTTGGTTAPTELTAVQQKLKQNTNLSAKVASRLPQGIDLLTAAAGFKNLGQFIAAVNVSNNLQLSFTELKAKMMTGMSLGQAIQAVRPLTASPTIEAQRAEYDARGMIYESDQTTPSTAAAPPSTTSASTPVKSKAKTKSSAQ
jgi:hypothetical protein